jgi:hypothetical protein
MTRVSPRGKRSIAVPTPNHDQTVTVVDSRNSVDGLDMMNIPIYNR